MKTARDHRNSTALGRGSVGTVAATIFVSTLTLLSTEASALDINGLAAMALNCARIMADTRCTIPERRRRRDATGIRMMQTTKFLGLRSQIGPHWRRRSIGLPRCGGRSKRRRPRRRTPWCRSTGRSTTKRHRGRRADFFGDEQMKTILRTHLA